MSAYTIIGKISETILKKLQDQLVPDLVLSAGQIALSSPAERENISLGIFLYDIQESELLRPHAWKDLSAERQQHPPIYLSLYYMITAYSSGDVRFRSIQEERILGRVVQYFHDAPVVAAKEADARIELQRVSTEDKLKLWNFPDQPYKVSLFYKVSPVSVDSALTREVRRVKQVKVNVDDTDGR